MRALLAFTLLLLASHAFAANEIDDKVEAALAAESRPAADRERDRNRRALETLNFFGLKDDMRVLELIPGGGWYTRVLAPVLAENGKLYVAIGTGRVKDGVLTDDLYAFALPQLAKIQRPANVHFTAEGSNALAEQVAASILKALGEGTKK